MSDEKRVANFFDLCGAEYGLRHRKKGSKFICSAKKEKPKPLPTLGAYLRESGQKVIRTLSDAEYGGIKERKYFCAAFAIMAPKSAHSLPRYAEILLGNISRERNAGIQRIMLEILYKRVEFQLDKHKEKSCSLPGTVYDMIVSLMEKETDKSNPDLEFERDLASLGIRIALTDRAFNHPRLFDAITAHFSRQIGYINSNGDADIDVKNIGNDAAHYSHLVSQQRNLISMPYITLLTHLICMRHKEKPRPQYVHGSSGCPVRINIENDELLSEKIDDDNQKIDDIKLASSREMLAIMKLVDNEAISPTAKELFSESSWDMIEKASIRRLESFPGKCIPFPEQCIFDIHEVMDLRGILTMARNPFSAPEPEYIEGWLRHLHRRRAIEPLVK